MWVMETSGFTSAVAHRSKLDSLMVRARDKQSLEGLAKASGKKVYTDFPSDYPFRIVVTRREYADYLFAKAMDIDYENFKSAVEKRRGKQWHDVYMRVWHVMQSVTPKKVDRQNRKSWAKYINRGRVKDYLADLEGPSEDDILREENIVRGLHTLTDAEWAEFESAGDPPF